MNREAWEKTIAEGRVTFWSRSRNKLWEKGETSGNFLELVSVESDCDGDALLIRAIPHGSTCHLGNKSCFGQNVPPNVVGHLWSIIESRKKEMPEDSYTSKLLRKGISKIAQKVGEEAVELAIASQHPDQQACISETADLLYHIMVLLSARNLTLEDVEKELSTRMEKAKG